MCHRIIYLTISFIAFSGFLLTVEATARTEGQNEGMHFVPIELQAAVMSFADSWASKVSEATNALAKEAATPEARREANRFKFYSILGAFEIAAIPYPGPALLDMLVLSTLSRMVWEAHRHPEAYGQSIKGMVEVLKGLETEIWSVAAKVMTPQQRRDVRDLIGQWRKKHPDKVGISFIRFGDFGELGRKPSLEKARKEGGLLAPVKEAVRAADEVKALADRALYLLVRMQELIGLRAQLLVDDVLATPEIDKLLSDITGFREVSERYAELIETIPAQISEQTNAVIESGMTRAALQSEEIVNHLVQQVATERRAALEQAFQGISQERKATFDQIVQGLEEQRTIAIRQVLQGVAKEREAIVRDLVQLADRGEHKAEALTAHIFVLVAASLFVFFLLWMALRCATEQPAGAGYGRVAASIGLGAVAVLVVISALAYLNRDLGQPSVPAGIDPKDLLGGKIPVVESNSQSSRTVDMQGKSDAGAVIKSMPIATTDIDNSSQSSAPMLIQKTPLPDQDAGIAPKAAADLRKTGTAAPEVSNPLGPVKRASQPETTSNKDLPDTDKKNARLKTETMEQKLQASAHPSTSEDPAQRASGYEQIIGKHILFATGSWQLKPDTHEILAQVAAHLQQNVRLRLKIEGHSDSRGAGDLNQKLSEKRAEAVAAYLVKSGVASHRLKTVGHGSSQPVATNETPEGRAQNRRVVLKTIPISKDGATF